MRLKPWLMTSYLIVMILPIIALYFFYISLSQFDEKRDFVEYMEMKEKIDQLEPLLMNPSLYKAQPIENYKQLQERTDSSMNIKLYRKDGLKLYSTLDQTGVEMYTLKQRDSLYQDLNTLKKEHRTYTYKQTVFSGDDLIGIYEVTIARNDWIEGVNHRTLILASFLFLSFVVIYFGVINLLNRKLTRPLLLLREEMNAFAIGKKGHKELPHSNDEIGDLISHFEKMREQIETTNKEVERQQQEKEYIVAALSHDLKTPLTAIHAYFEALNGRQDLTEQEKEEYRAVIFEKLNYMKEMINDLTLFTTLKSAKNKLEFVEVDGAEFFEMLLGGYEGPCRKREINLISEQAVTGNFLLNVKQMVRVVDNLMMNAIRYTEKGKNIWLAAVSQTSPLPEWVFAPFVEELEAWRENGTILLIQNEGKAIPEDDLEKVFEPFVQVEAARGQGGTSGLGLSIAKMAIEQHCGKIKIWSQTGYGTLVACWLQGIDSSSQE